MDTMQELGLNSVSKIVFLSSKDANPEVWEVITDHLNKKGQVFTEHYSPEKARWLVENKHMDLWTGGPVVAGSFYLEIYAFTSIRMYEKKKVFHIWFVGGKNIKHYMPTLKVFHNFATENDCTHIECNARFGLERLLERIGLYPISAHFSMPLRKLKELN